MKVFKFAVAVAVVATLFVGCSKQVVKTDPFKDRNITNPDDTLRDYELNKIGDQIYMNETGGNPKYLMYWSPRETFPSLGYGHFIWYPSNQPQKFDQTFPAMIQYYIDNKVEIPKWLEKQKTLGAPWANKQEFERARGSNEFQQLKTLLVDTKALQIKFFYDRVKESIPEIMDNVSKADQKHIKQNYEALANTAGGWYPLIDYINFKGKGLKGTEKYNNQGWGLLQVLKTMRPVQKGPQALQEFSRAAQVVLEQRVRNKPSERTFLRGWIKRAKTYATSIY
ncbi:hypothetical protein MNB_SV-12-184 [hydrothermal vent metagenome]|uniref:Uncharacterized protein n=1 Tax=hydrothermal vent metagenome TaxID=652676 RepID=A0A1W1BTY0_9ZZZZ